MFEHIPGDVNVFPGLVALVNIGQTPGCGVGPEEGDESCPIVRAIGRVGLGGKLVGIIDNRFIEVLVIDNQFIEVLIEARARWMEVVFRLAF